MGLNFLGTKFYANARDERVQGCRPDAEAKGVVRSLVRVDRGARENSTEAAEKNGRAPSRNFVNNLEGERSHPLDNSTILENRFWKRGDQRNRFLFFFLVRKGSEKSIFYKPRISEIVATCRRVTFRTRASDSKARRNVV